MRQVDPGEIFRGTTLVVAPHMDDCVLACGGAIARLPSRKAVHMAYATDGARAPAPELPWVDETDAGLPAARKSEARRAMAILGLPPDNVHFLDLPDGGLRRHRQELRTRLVDLIGRTGATRALVPFRYDRHPDHLAVHRAVTSAVLDGALSVEVYEFFVYHRWKLLPRGDVRRYIGGDALLMVDVSEVSDIKRRALEAFTSQTTRYYAWQSRPNLTPELVQQVSREPEAFLRFDPRTAGARVLEGPVAWIRVAHRLEPLLKRHKDRVVAVARRLTGRTRWKAAP
jgi:LmbE family N-acetylglucosaminyl deacetylase